MKIRSLFLSLPLLLSPALVQASDKLAEQDIFGLWVLKQNGGLFKDIHGVVGHNLIALEHHGVRLPAGTGKKWVPVEKIVSDLAAFRDSESSEAEVAAVLENKEQIKEGLLKKLSAQWDGGLEDLAGKSQKQENGSWHAVKAYAAAFLAYYTVELDVAKTVAAVAGSDTALNPCMAEDFDTARLANDAAMDSVWNAAERALWGATEAAARDDAYYDAFRNQVNCIKAIVRAPVKSKLEVLALMSAREICETSHGLAELFSLLWLTENGHKSMKEVFAAAYDKLPEMELTEVQSKIAVCLYLASTENPKLNDNMFIKAFKRDLKALEKFVLAQ